MSSSQNTGCTFSNEPFPPMAKTRRNPKQSRETNPVQEIVIYAIFMAFFTVSSLRGNFDADSFYFAENLRSQFGVEFLEEHSPNTGKTFVDIATVEEWYQWMQGPLLVGKPPPILLNYDAAIWGFPCHYRCPTPLSPTPPQS